MHHTMRCLLPGDDENAPGCADEDPCEYHKLFQAWVILGLHLTRIDLIRMTVKPFGIEPPKLLPAPKPETYDIKHFFQMQAIFHAMYPEKLVTELVPGDIIAYPNVHTYTATEHQLLWPVEIIFAVDDPEHRFPAYAMRCHDGTYLDWDVDGKPATQRVKPRR